MRWQPSRSAILDHRRARLFELRETAEALRSETDPILKLEAIQSFRKAEASQREISDGTILIGLTTADEPNYAGSTEVKVSTRDVLSNVVIAGMPGSGKSVTAYHLALEMTRSGIQVFIYDSKFDHPSLYVKDDWIWMPSHLWLENRHTPPPGVPLHVYQESESEIFAISHDLATVGANVLKDCVRLTGEARAQKGQLDSITDYDIALVLRDQLRRASFKDRAIIDVSRRLLQRLIQEGRRLLDQRSAIREGITQLDLTGYNVVRDISDLSGGNITYTFNHDKNWSYQHRKWNRLLSHKPKVRIIEEATTYLTPRFVLPLPHFDDLYRTTREDGESCALIVHSIEALPKIIKNSTQVWILHACANEREIREFQKITGMDDEHFELARELAPGEAICKIGRIPNCVKIRVPFHNIEKKLDRGQLERNTRGKIGAILEKVTYVEPEISSTALGNVIASPETDRNNATEIKRRADKLMQDQLDEFLTCLHANPLSSYDMVRGLLSFSKQTSTIDKIKKHALERKLVSSYAGLRFTKGRGRSPVYLGITERGRDRLIEIGRLKPGQKLREGKGGHPHFLIVGKLLEAHSSVGDNNETEGFVNRADATVMGADGRPELCYEISITTSVENEITNLRRNVEQGFKQAMVIVAQFAPLAGKENEFALDDDASRKKAARLQEAVAGEPGLSTYSVKTMTAMEIAEYLDGIRNRQRRLL